MSLNLDTRHRAMLAELGVRVWWPLAAAVVSDTIENVATRAYRTGATGQKDQKLPVTDNRLADSANRDAGAPASPAPRLHTAPGPVSRRAVPAEPSAQAALQPLPDGIDSMDWPTLAAAVTGCAACSMGRGRSLAVFAPPPPGLRCDWLVLGDSPDAAQERAGRPFVDDAGHLLDRMLAAAGVQRLWADDAAAAAGGPAQSAYLSLAHKCHPPRPTPPDASALAVCAHYLKREIALLQPKVILSVGRLAMQVLLSEDHPEGLKLPLGKLRGQVWHYQGVPVVLTYPLDSLLRRGQDKAHAWADLCLALDVVQGHGKRQP